MVWVAALRWCVATNLVNGKVTCVGPGRPAVNYSKCAYFSDVISCLACDSIVRQLTGQKEAAMRISDEYVPPTARYRTPVVVTLLLVAAGVASYLWAYALSDALVAGHLMDPLDEAVDPRPHQMKTAFFVIAGTFLVIGLIVRSISARHMRRIDAMVDE